MDRTTLNNLLKTEDKDLSLQSLLTISRMNEKFPYSSLLHLYKAKISAKIKHLDREDILRTSAIYCPERPLLKMEVEKIVSMLANITVINQEYEKNLDNKSVNKEEAATKDELVDKFLNTDGGIKPNVKDKSNDTFDIDKNVKNSVNDDFKIVTETMAKIYLKQGNKDKAIKIYKQLMADNPEKSIYFANQIKRIEDN
ncbi:MAG: hypothetical protein LBL74_06275 [Bacteroidales bacterium]|jgi:tetratricopeptide (TPR) repeat protein|nr:hypothetical protein [Bacteroidales bacterium]